MGLQRRATRVTIVVLAVIAAIAIAGVVAVQWASTEIKQRITQVLGPNGSAERIEVGLYTVHLEKVRLGAPAGWPAADSLRAERIDIVPDWPAWFSHRLHFRSVDIYTFYQSALRTREGKLVVLPGLRENVERMSQARQVEHPSSETVPRSPLEVDVDQITLHDGQFDYFDEKIASPPFAVHMDAFNASIGSLNFPALSKRSTLRIAAKMGGGTLALDGWLQFDTRDSEFTIALTGVDAKTLQPYLLRGQKATITSGTLDLSLHWQVQSYVLHAPGKLSLNHLEIEPQGGGPVNALASIPKKAALNALKNDQGRIDINFELAGDLRDPKFSIEEDWYKRMGAGFAKAAGVTVEGVGKTAGDAAKDIGSALKSLIGH